MARVKRSANPRSPRWPTRFTTRPAFVCAGFPSETRGCSPPLGLQACKRKSALGRTGVDSSERLPLESPRSRAPDTRSALNGGLMASSHRRPSATRWLFALLLLIAVTSVLLPQIALAQGLTGALIGTVKDDQGGVLPGAVVRVTSPALIGGSETLTTNEKGQLRFAVLPPGPYVLDIALEGVA